LTGARGDHTLRLDPELELLARPRRRAPEAVMASGGVLARLANLWKGFLSLWVSDLEKEHPEIAYENAINGMIEKYTQLKKATAAIIRRREDIEARLSAQRKELEAVQRDLDTAVATNQDDLALVLIQKKSALGAEVGELAGDLQTAASDAEGAKASLLQVQGEIQKLKAEKDAMLAKAASAQARLRIQEQLDGLSVDAEVKALDNVREHIKNLAAEAKLGSELRESSLEDRLAKLRAQSGDVNARAELERLKAAAAAKAQKTM
jgi:phage shock protein A